MVDGRYVDLGPGDVGALLASRADWRAWAENAEGAAFDVEPAQVAPVIPRPGKILCVGLNYRTHITEMGRDLPEYPTLFATYTETLIGPYDTVALPPESDAVDWEAELVVVLGRPVRRVDREAAQEAIAGYTVMNDVSMRDWQFRTKEWLQGKTWEASTPLGPCMVTADELASDAAIDSGVIGSASNHVEGAAADLARWLTGRGETSRLRSSSGARLPDLPSWL